MPPRASFRRQIGLPGTPEEEYAKQVAFDQAVAAQIGVCMAAKGLPVQIQPPAPLPVLGLGLSPADFVKSHGFGIVDGAMMALGSKPSATRIEVPSDLQADALLPGVREDGQPIDAARPAASGGCLDDARKTVEATPGHSWHQRAADLATKTAAMQAQIDGDSRTRQLWAQWKSCMAGSGVRDADRRDDLVSGFNAELSTLLSATKPDPTVLAAGGSQLDAMPATPRSALDQLRGREFRAARASFLCEAKIDPQLDRVASEYQEQLIASVPKN